MTPFATSDSSDKGTSPTTTTSTTGESAPTPVCTRCGFVFSSAVTAPTSGPNRDAAVRTRTLHVVMHEDREYEALCGYELVEGAIYADKSAAQHHRRQLDSKLTRTDRSNVRYRIISMKLPENLHVVGPPPSENGTKHNDETETMEIDDGDGDGDNDDDSTKDDAISIDDDTGTHSSEEEEERDEDDDDKAASEDSFIVETDDEEEEEEEQEEEEASDTDSDNNNNNSGSDEELHSVENGEDCSE